MAFVPLIHSRLRPMSENTLGGVFGRVGYAKDEMTSHGFRATASTLLNESGKWSPDAMEAELAHVGADPKPQNPKTPNNIFEINNNSNEKSFDLLSFGD